MKRDSRWVVWQQSTRNWRLYERRNGKTRFAGVARGDYHWLSFIFYGPVEKKFLDMQRLAIQPLEVPEVSRIAVANQLSL